MKKTVLPLLFTLVLSLFLSVWIPIKPSWASNSISTYIEETPNFVNLEEEAFEEEAFEAETFEAETPEECTQNAINNFPKADKQHLRDLCNGISPAGWDNGKPFSIIDGDGGGTTDGKNKWFSPYQ